MDKKDAIRKKYFLKRKKKYFKVDSKFFTPLIKLLKKKFRNKHLNISIYYPNNYEVDILEIFKIEYFSNSKFLLPIIENNNSMNFYIWKKNDILFVNKYGILETEKTKIVNPNVILVPVLAFDKNKNRLGYGKGFYDKYLNKYFQKNKKKLAVGVAFSFQKYNNLPTNNDDFKLHHIITDKGII